MFDKYKSVWTVLAAFAVAVLWSLLDVRGHMSAAIGWKGNYFHVVQGLDVAVWAALFYAFGRMTLSECFGVTMIGVAIVVAPDTIVSFMEGGKLFLQPTYKETLARIITLTVIVAFALAWLNDYLSEIDRRQDVAKAE